MSSLSIHLILKQLCGLLLTAISPFLSLSETKSKIGQRLGLKFKKKKKKGAGKWIDHDHLPWNIKKLTVIEEKKWNKQYPAYHTFIIDGLVVSQEAGERKIVSIQIRSSVFYQAFASGFVCPFLFSGFSAVGQARRNKWQQR